MTRHREERTYTITLHLSAEFDEAYEGELDGLAWHREFDRTLRPRIARAVIEALRADGAFKVTPISRGLSEHDALELTCERKVD